MRWKTEVRQRTLCRAAALAALLVVVCVSSAFAQFDRGTISGTIKDPQGAVVPGVTVTITSTQTQQARTTVSDGSGFYTFPNLQPGRYDIAAELQGFKKVNRQGVQLDAAAALTLDFALETGALTEEVTVTAMASLLQTDVAVRKTVEAKDIEIANRLARSRTSATLAATCASVSGYFCSSPTFSMPIATWLSPMQWRANRVSGCRP